MFLVNLINTELYASHSILSWSQVTKYNFLLRGDSTEKHEYVFGHEYFFTVVKKFLDPSSSVFSAEKI